MQKIAKNSPSGHHRTTLSGYIFATEARHSSSGRQPNFAASNRGRHLYSAGRPSRWALAHILVLFYFLSSCLLQGKPIVLMRSSSLLPQNIRLRHPHKLTLYHCASQLKYYAATSVFTLFSTNSLRHCSCKSTATNDVSLLTYWRSYLSLS